MKNFKLLVCAFVFLCCNNAMAGMLLMQYESNKAKKQYTQQRNIHLNRHFIVAIDGAMPKYTNELLKNSTKEYVENLLNEYFEYDKNDFLSLVTYQVDLSNPDFNRFAFAPHISNGTSALWKQQDKVDFSALGNWAGMVIQQNRFVGINKASFQSAAKQYILQAVKQSSNLGANDTYIIMLSDEKVNGVDDNYQLEWNNISTSRGSRIAPYREEVFSKLKNINQRYQFEPVRFYGQYKHEFAHIAKEPFVLAIYKVRPTIIPSIQSIANIPAQLPFKKVRGGYAFDLDLSTTDPMYLVSKTELILNGKNKKYTSKESKLNQVIDKEVLSEGDTVTVRVWVNYKDGIYNGLVMDPYDKDYQKGLTITQSVIFKDDAKIFGKITMPDFLWWFWADDIQAIVIFWDVVFILLFIIVVCILAYKWFKSVTSYVPNNDSIKISHM